MKMLPGDTLFLKIAATYNPRSEIYSQGLDFLEGNLPAPVASTVHGAREVPEWLRSELMSLLGLSPEPKPKEKIAPQGAKAIASDKDFISAVNKLTDSALRAKKQMQTRQDTKRNSNDFYLDDEVFPLGPTVNLSPASIQL